MMSYANALPGNRDLFYGGGWNAPLDGGRQDLINPANGESLGSVGLASTRDVDAAVREAHRGFRIWSALKPSERADILRKAAAVILLHSDEIALVDSADSGGPFKRMIRDAESGAAAFEYFAGLATELKGVTTPLGPDTLSYTLHEPLGVVVRINAFNHPFLFAAARAAPALIAGNSVIIKPPEQAPLSSLKLAELVGDLFPPGVLSVLPGARECGTALVDHPMVAKVGLIGSVATGKAIARGASETLKKISLELGGKNALIAFPDADPTAVANGAVQGMNFTWCGQSCGSTSRIFLHDSIHDAVVEKILNGVKAFSFGMPTDAKTEMGCLVSREQRERTESYVKLGVDEGATLVAGGFVPSDAPFSNGFFYPPTVFVDVRPDMRIAREEIFGPVMSIIRWKNETEMFDAVNGSELGLTASIWSRDLSVAHRAAARVEAGYLWINGTSTHHPGTSFGGYKLSGIGREESIEEMYASTQMKTINVSL
jgi:betaine-aldehyde dehydrogenase